MEDEKGEGKKETEEGEKEVGTLLKLRVSAAITKVALSYLKGRKEIHHATTKTVCTQDKMAQRESEQLDRVPYGNQKVGDEGEEEK